MRSIQKIIIEKSGQAPDHAKEIQEKQKDVDKIQKQIEKLIDLFALDGIDPATIQKKIKEANAKKKTLENQIRTLEMDTESQMPALLPELDEILAVVPDILDHGNLEEKRLLIDSLISKIEIDGEDVTIHWKFL